MEREMREISSTITTKGQVTIPIEVRRLLGVEPHDQVAFVVEGDKVELKRKESVVARTAGALRSDRSIATDEELREAAETAIAEEAMRRMGG
jgi:AbrB family looped-hinge helix DNA binding protein